MQEHGADKTKFVQSRVGRTVVSSHFALHSLAFSSSNNHNLAKCRENVKREKGRPVGEITTFDLGSRFDESCEEISISLDNYNYIWQ